MGQGVWAWQLTSHYLPALGTQGCYQKTTFFEAQATMAGSRGGISGRIQVRFSLQLKTLTGALGQAFQIHHGLPVTCPSILFSTTSLMSAPIVHLGLFCPTDRHSGKSANVSPRGQPRHCPWQWRRKTFQAIGSSPEREGPSASEDRPEQGGVAQDFHIPPPFTSTPDITIAVTSTMEGCGPAPSSELPTLL